MSGITPRAKVYIPEVKKTPPRLHRKHRADVLGKLHHQRSISRSELSKVTGLSAATISRITKDLVDGEVLREVRPSRSRVGRPSPGLEINVTAVRELLSRI